jgi:energy-coupling factor transporter ATP-binding protein EcfA2
MQLIGLIGAKGSGKSTVANSLELMYGFERLRLADGLKKMLKTMGLTEAQIDGAEKEFPLPLLCGKTPRYAMQTLGTEWGRGYLGNDVWVNVCINEIVKRQVQTPFARIVVDDIRFPNEADMVASLGGVLVRVIRPGYGDNFPPRWQFWRKQPHPSERYWTQLPANHELVNNKAEEELMFQTAQLGEKLGLQPLKNLRRVRAHA